MLSPKRTKFRKQFKGRIHGLTKGASTLDFGSFGLKALEQELKDDIDASSRVQLLIIKAFGKDEAVVSSEKMTKIVLTIVKLLKNNFGKLPAELQNILNLYRGR